MAQRLVHGMEGQEIPEQDGQTQETFLAFAEQTPPAFENGGRQADCLAECNGAQKEIEPSQKG
jgi:hypothetical protein